MTGFIEYLVANPILLVPLLLVGAMIIFAILKKLLKIAAILVIAAGLYVVLVRFLDGGF